MIHYEFYLKTIRHCAHNTSLKYVKNLKAVINFAGRQEWIVNNPLNRYKGNLLRVDKDFLTEKELHSIENKIFFNERINEVRDVFVFCCYTGLAYSDSVKLNKQNIVIGMNGGKQINIKRTKTDVMANIPLLSKAIEIIEKYAPLRGSLPGVWYAKSQIDANKTNLLRKIKCQKRNHSLH